MRIAVLGNPSYETSCAEEAAAALREAGHDAKAVSLVSGAAVDLVTYRPDIVFDACGGEAVSAVHAWEMAKLVDTVCVGSSEYACRLAGDRRLLAGVMDAYQDAFGSDLTSSWLAGVCVSKLSFEQWGADAFLGRIAERAFGYPLCVKPATGGSAVRVDDEAALEKVLRDVFATNDEAIVRQWVEGVELRVCVLGSGWDAYALPLVEVSCTGDGVLFTAPVRLDSLSADESDAQAIVFEIERAALEAYNAFGMRDYGTIDMVWDGGQARVLDIQAHPSLASNREFHAACTAAGLSMPAVLDALVSQYE